MSGVGITHFKDPDLHYALNAMSANGDPEKAFDLLVLLEESEEGIIKDYNPNIKLLGAVNRNGVTCYLDATLFAMFARLESFEAILYNTFQDAKKKRLATLLRFWVNTLRVGKLITVDIVREHAQNSHVSSADTLLRRQNSFRKHWQTADGKRLQRNASKMLRKHSRLLLKSSNCPCLP